MSSHLILHEKQKQIEINPARFKVIRAGRKSGKTRYEVEKICYKAIISASKLNLSTTDFPTGRKVIYIAPTQSQARKIIWEALKRRLEGIGKFNESMLEMRVGNEDGETSTIYVGGWENRENYRGLADVIHITFDEVDTLRSFFIYWKEIFRPMFLDTGGSADFIGTPQKENPNLRRLEKEAEGKPDWATFHFTSKDNPYIMKSELDSLLADYENDKSSYQQEVLAEYVENIGALFHYSALVDVFSNTITKKNDRFLIVDIADDGFDKTTFSFWEGLEEYRREKFQRLNTENIIEKIREYALEEKVPYSHIMVDAVGVGAGVASSSLLDGIIGFKGSYASIKTEKDITYILQPQRLHPYVPMVSDYKNLRSQCIFNLAYYVNNHLIASRLTGREKEIIIEELSNYQDVSKGDGKRFATPKEDIKESIGRSPDDSDTWIMRMYFEIRKSIDPESTPEAQRRKKRQDTIFMESKLKQPQNSSE